MIYLGIFNNVDKHNLWYDLLGLFSFPEIWYCLLLLQFNCKSGITYVEVTIIALFIFSATILFLEFCRSLSIDKLQYFISFWSYLFLNPFFTVNHPSPQFPVLVMCLFNSFSWSYSVISFAGAILHHETWWSPYSLISFASVNRPSIKISMRGWVRNWRQLIIFFQIQFCF